MPGPAYTFQHCVYELVRNGREERGGLRGTSVKLVNLYREDYRRETTSYGFL